MIAALRSRRKRSNEVVWNLRVDRELRNGIKARAALAGQTIEDYLNDLLCRDLGREDLLSDKPESVSA